MKPPPKELVECLLRIRQTNASDYKNLTNFLKMVHVDLAIGSTKVANVEQLRWQQGHSQAFEYLYKIFNDIDESKERYENEGRKPNV